MARLVLYVLTGLGVIATVAAAAAEDLPGTPYKADQFDAMRVTDTWKKYAGTLTWGKGQCLAILDDGCDLSVPQWKVELPWGKKVIAGYDSIDGDADPTPVPPGYHGTSVGFPSSLNYNGTLGVAFNNHVAQVRCVSVVHLRKDESQTMAAGLQWVIDNHKQHNITAVNLSPLDDQQHKEPVPTAVDDKLKRLRELGIWVSAPCGNHHYTDGISWPACQPHCFAIGGTVPGKHVAHLDRYANTDLLVAATATSSSNAHAAGCAMILREAIEKSGYGWKQDGETLPDAMLAIFQQTGRKIDDAKTGLTFRELDLLAAVDHVMTAENGSAKEKVFRAGAYAMDITPTKFPVSSNGGMTDRQVTRAHDPLHARCLVLDDGRTRMAIVICDSCMIPRDLFDAAKERASKSTGIPTSQMLMSATHTHTGVTVTGVFQSEPDEEYRQFLVERIAAGVERAAAQLEPARIGWGEGSDPSQVFNRRWFMQPGIANEDPFGGTSDQVRMNPGNKNLAKPSGPVDPQACFLSVQSKSGRPMALLANYSLHYVGGVPGDSLSADYFGEFARRIGERLGAGDVDPPFVGIMSNGTSGNINNVDFTLESRPKREPFEQIQLVAASVANAVFEAHKKIEHHDWVPLDMRETEIELGVRLPSDADLEYARKLLAAAGEGPYSKRPDIYARETVLMAHYPKSVQVKLQAIRIGELGIVSSPCETFVETGLAIKKDSPFPTTFTIELANGYNGYLPTLEHHEWGGYETWRARSSYLAVDAEPKIRRTLLELLGRIAP